MNFEEAYLTIVNASKEKDTIEIPTILSCLDFKNKKCLEIGCGPLARLAIKITKAGAKSITCLENYDETLKKAKKQVEKENLSNKIKIYLNKEKYTLPFKDSSFDIVYGAWLPHNLVTNKEFLSELVRVAKESILLVMPGTNDDLVKMKSIVYPKERERREKYKEEITNYLKEKNLKISLKEAKLKTDFKDFKEIKSVFEVFDFSKGYNGKEKEVDEFLKEKMHNMQNSFYCLIARKQINNF